MAFYTAGVPTYTPVAHADGASALANNSYSAVRTTAATNFARIVEVYVGGLASTSTPQQMALRRLSTNASSPTAVAPAPLSNLSAACVASSYVAATTGPTIASTVHLLNLPFNSFGGLVRWVAAPGEEIWFGTATAPNAEVCLDSISGTGAVGQDIKFEEM